MTPRLLSVLAAATLVAVAAAGYAVSQDREFETVAANTKVFPGLRDKLNDVTKLKMVTDKRQMTLVRGGSNWTMEESDGYAAEVKTIQKVLIGLADLVYAEAKTRKPELYAKLDLREPSIKQARGRHVTVTDQNNKTLVDVILGKTRYNMPGTTRDGIYLRFPGEKQAWLSIGQIEASKLPADWLKTQILSIEGKEIKQAVFTHPDGHSLRVYKTAETDVRYQLAELAEGKKLKYESDPKNMATVLEEMVLDDVRKASHFDFSTSQTIKASFQTFDGLTIDLQMIELKTASTDEDDNEQSAFWVKLSAKSDSPETAERAKQISARTEGWAFQLPNYKGSRLNNRLADIVTDKKPKS